MLCVVAVQAVRLALDRDVLVSGQRLVAQVAAEVLDVPGLVLRPGVLRRKDELVAGLAARDVGVLGVVAGAKDAAVVVVVQQVNQDLLQMRMKKNIRLQEGFSLLRLVPF